MADALMFSLFGFLAIGPLFFAIVGGVILHKKFETSLWRSMGLVLLAMFMYAGIFMTSLKYSPTMGFASFGVSPALENLRLVLLGLIFVWLLILLITLLPFVHLAFARPERNSKRSLKATLYSGLAIFTGILLGCWPVSNTSLLFPSAVTNWHSLLPDGTFDLYFISDAKIFRLDLSKDQPEEISNSESGAKLFLRPVQSGEVEIFVRSDQGEFPLLKTKVSEKLIEADLAEQESLIGYKPTAETFVPPALQLATPIMRLLNGRDNMLPAGEVVFEIGGKIYVYNWHQRKISFLADGRSPLLILKP